MVSTKTATAKKTAVKAPAKTSPPSPTVAPKVAVTTPAKPAPAAAKSVAAKKVRLATKPVAKSVPKPKTDKPVKPKKPKLVRDSFTIPKPEYLVLDDLKARANKLASPAKKSELLRAGIKALAAMPDAAFQAALKAVPAIKTGRPAKD